MNNEIKEILEKLKDREETYQFCQQYNLAINDWIYEAHYLLDYITNLQQENETRQQDINNLTYQLAKMKEENERLKEEKDNLYLDNAMLKMEKDIYKTGYEELKELIEKTITEVNNE